MWPALIGFIITGVGLPLLGVAALGISRSSGLFELSGHIGRPYGYFFTCALYLTIGPFFAIPRCATTSFTVGIEQIIPQGSDKLSLYLLLFSLAFFVAALLFSLYPGKIMVWVGKILNPAFLLFLGILVVVTLVNPGAAIAEVEPAGDYATVPFFEGFIEGYNTLDALASLAFGIVVVNVIRGLGVEDGDAVASNTVRAGIFSCLLMAVIYFFVTLIGVHSRGVMASAENGGVALAQIAKHYLGAPGLIVLAATVTLACLKTSVGLITSCAETFAGMFKGLSYRAWAIIFSVVAFGFANFGLSNIISYSLPVLMFLYPLAIVLISLLSAGSSSGMTGASTAGSLALPSSPRSMTSAQACQAMSSAPCTSRVCSTLYTQTFRLRTSVSAGSAPPPSVWSSALPYTSSARKKLRPHNA